MFGYLPNDLKGSQKLRCFLAWLLLWYQDLRDHKRRMKYFHYLMKMQHLPRVEIEKIQRHRLFKLLQYAQREIPYYSKIMGGMKIDEEHIVELLRDLPMLTKDIIRDRFNELHKIRDGVSTYRNTSGGSTGEPVLLMQDRDYSDWNEASKLLVEGWAGYFPGLSKIVLWGADRDMESGNLNVLQKLSRNLLNSRMLNSYRISDDNMGEFVACTNYHKPHTILAYVESIDDIARYIEKRTIFCFSPHAIITAAGTLFDEVRRRLEEVFDCSVYNNYGSREVGGIAFSCHNDEGLHVLPFTQFVELLKPDGSLCTKEGEEGEVVITLLTNYTMPLIRYRIGDRAVLGPRSCDCGIKFPLLKEVQGRISDIIVTPDGNHMDAHLFNHLFFFKPWLKRYQVVQEQEDCIKIKIELSSVADAKQLCLADQKEISERINEISKALKIRYEIVEMVEKTLTGKYRYVVSRL